jgi:hypothetical protein
MQRPRSLRAGDDNEQWQKGFLPDFREAIKAARGPAVKRAAKGQSGIWRNPQIRTAVDFAGRGLRNSGRTQAEIMRLPSQH